jgi:hypothetical protein
MERTGFFLCNIWQFRLSGRYWKRSLGPFYSNFFHRLLCYLLMAMAYIIYTFLFAFLLHNRFWTLSNLTFVSAYALHVASLYTACYFAADFVADRLGLKTYKYHERTAARQWLVMLIGFVLAFTIHRSTYDSVVSLYEPYIVLYFNTYPEMRRGFAAEFLLYLLCWTPIAFTIIRISLKNQKDQAVATIEKQIPNESKPSINNEAGVSTLVHQAEGKTTIIDQAKVTHVSVEDHYCRIHFLNGHDVSNVLQRLTLKQLQAEFNGVGFVKIHRSHMVNLDHALGWKIEKHKHYMVMEHGVELPISRSRMAELKPDLKRLRLPKLN